MPGPFAFQWQVQSRKLRAKYSALQLQPWSQLPGLEFRGLSRTSRVLEVLDLAVIGYLTKPGTSSSLLSLEPAELRGKCTELFTDVSQNPVRKCHTSQAGLSKCLTTSSVLYTHTRDRVVLPLELMFFQGHVVDMKVPATMRQRSLKSLAGQGMCVPCLAVLIYALHCTDSLEV